MTDCHLRLNPMRGITRPPTGGFACRCLHQSCLNTDSLVTLACCNLHLEFPCCTAEHWQRDYACWSTPQSTARSSRGEALASLFGPGGYRLVESTTERKVSVSQPPLSLHHPEMSASPRRAAVIGKECALHCMLLDLGRKWELFFSAQLIDRLRAML